MSAPATRSAVAALVAGTVFGVGLAVAQMTDPRKVLGFLDLAGAWDPSLLFVLGGAVVLSALGYRFVLRRRAPVFGARFFLPLNNAVDSPLLLGSALFGAGWGLVGYCPGPAIASVGFLNAEALWFLPAMLGGAALARWWQRQSASRSLIGSEATAND